MKSATKPDVGLLCPVESLEGVGPSRGRSLRALGVGSLGELLEYFPRTYQFETAELTISQLSPGPVQTVRGEVVAVDYLSGGSRPRFEATLDDGTGKLSLAWFNGAYLRSRIHPGQRIRVRGKVRYFRNLPQMSQPKWEPVDEQTDWIDRPTFRPIYPATARLPSEAIQRIVEANLETALGHIAEWFDEPLLRRRRLLTRPEALRLIHRAADFQEAAWARRRLVYDELMLLQLGLQIGRRQREGRLTAPVMRIDRLLDQRIAQRFPFELTGAQRQASWEIARDLGAAVPMNRLLQGDVGSGKTVVAVYAMLIAVANKLQSALLAPTEVLAEQHYLTLRHLLAGSNVGVTLVTGRTKRGDRDGLLSLAAGRTHIAIGTSALIQQDVEFANLGLVVVDEQHKLGVRQRAVLKGKGVWPHYLVMTATPIPRTLALSFFADFDVTTLRELPPGRQPIQTRLIRSTRAGEAYDFVRQEVGKGRQAYLVVPQIDSSSIDDAKSVLKEFKRLCEGPLSGLRLAPLHGKMNADEKQAAMDSFRGGQIDVLVTTTVIEVGVDVPNATVMLIDNAERFGLSQLHQLRGRVGRGIHPSHCLLLSDAAGEETLARLQAMIETTDGFAIAEKDLELRGPGEFFGTRQHGLPEFKLADLNSELELLQLAKQDAIELLSADPQLTHPSHQALRAALKQQLGDSPDLAQVG